MAEILHASYLIDDADAHRMGAESLKRLVMERLYTELAKGLIGRPEVEHSVWRREMQFATEHRLTLGIFNPKKNRPGDQFRTPDGRVESIPFVPLPGTYKINGVDAASIRAKALDDAAEKVLENVEQCGERLQMTLRRIASQIREMD